MVFSTIPPVPLPELKQALQYMRNRRSADDAGLVLEMFKMGCNELHECLPEICNRMLLQEYGAIMATYSFQDATQTW